MTDAHDRRVLRAHAAANQALDEAPSEHTRAAILAAATRAAGARPEPVGRVRRWRLPLAAAASLLVGTLAVLLATRIDESVPETTPSAPPIASVASPPAAEPEARGEAAAPGAKAADAIDAASPGPTALGGVAAPTTEGKLADADEAAKPDSAASGLRKQRPPAAPSGDRARGDGAPAVLEEKSASEVGITARLPAVPGRDLARSDSAPAVLAEKTAPEVGASAAAPAAAKPEQPADGRLRTAPLAAQRAREEQSESRQAANADKAKESTWRATAETWIERIVKLRAEGRHDDADAELALLRARHPDLRLPLAVLPPPGR